MSEGPPTELAGAEAQPMPIEGLTPPSQAGPRQGFLSDVIVELGFASEESVQQAILDARQAGRTVATALLETGVVDESQLARAVAERHGLAHAELDEFDVDPTAVRLISRTAAQRYRAAPIAFGEDGALLVAFADPVDAFAVSDIEVATKSDVRPVVAAPSAIDALIATVPVEAAGSNGVDAEAEDANGIDAEAEDSNEASATAEESTPPPPEDSGEVTQPAPAAQEPVEAAHSQSGPVRGEDLSSRFQDKVASLLEEALEGAAESEMAELERELERAREEIEELGDQLDAARREQAEHAQSTEALREQLSSAQGAGATLKEALSKLLEAASEAEAAADALENELIR